MKVVRTSMAVLLAAIALAGCGSSMFSGSTWFGGSKAEQPTETVNPDIYPANYRAQLVNLLRKALTNRADYQNALIAPPVLKPVPDSKILHYVVCLQLNGNFVQKNKMAVYLAGQPTEYIDSTPQQCGDAAYQPFTELARAVPTK